MTDDDNGDDAMTTTATEDVELEELPKKILLRRFRLKRTEDDSGVSGVGYVAEGIQFSDGTCVIHWTSETSCTGIYRSCVEMIHIHGHGGKTVIDWVDPEFLEKKEKEKQVQPDIDSDIKNLIRKKIGNTQKNS